MLSCLVVLFILNAICFLGCASPKKIKNEASSQSLSSTSEKTSKLIYNYLEGLKYYLTGEYYKAFMFFNNAIREDPNCASCYFQLSKIASQLGERSKALEYAKKAYSLENNNFWYAALYLTYLLEIGSFKEAENVVISYFKNTKDTNIYFLQTLFEIYLRENKYREAAQTLEALKIYLSSELEYFRLKIQVLAKMNESEKINKFIDSLIQINDNNLDFYYLRLYAKELLGDTSGLMDIYKSIYKKFGPVKEILQPLFIYYYFQNNKDSSKIILSHIIENPEINPRMKIQMIASLIYSSADSSFLTYEEKLFFLEKLMNTNPSEYEPIIMYADLIGRYDKSKAKYYYKKALTIKPSYYDLWLQVISAEIEDNNYDSAKILISQAKELFITEPFLHYINGYVLYKQDSFYQAIKSVKNALNLIISSSQIEIDCYTLLGDIYFHAEQPDTAYYYYEKAILSGDSTKTHVALNNYAYFMALRGENLDKAFQMSKKSLEVQPNNPAYLDTYGYILFKMGQIKEAKEFIQKAIDYSPNPDPDILEHMGDILFMENDINGSLKYWKMAKEKGSKSKNLDKKIKDKKYYP